MSHLISIQKTLISQEIPRVLTALCQEGSGASKDQIYFLYHNVQCCAKSLQSCLTLCSPMDYCPPSSSVHGILQARILEWVAIFLSRDLPNQ